MGCPWTYTATYPTDPGALIGDSIAAIRGLIAATVLARDNVAAIVRDLWRHTHQTRVMISHY